VGQVSHCLGVQISGKNVPSLALTPFIACSYRLADAGAAHCRDKRSLEMRQPWQQNDGDSAADSQRVHGGITE